MTEHVYSPLQAVTTFIQTVDGAMSKNLMCRTVHNVILSKHSIAYHYGCTSCTLFYITLFVHTSNDNDWDWHEVYTLYMCEWASHCRHTLCVFLRQKSSPMCVHMQHGYPHTRWLSSTKLEAKLSLCVQHTQWGELCIYQGKTRDFYLLWPNAFQSTLT